MSKFTDLCLCLFLLLVGCSETASVAGTAEEPNELAVLESSSSIEVVESSSDVAYSSSALSSSSEKAADIVSSSSLNVPSSSAEVPPSSSSVEDPGSSSTSSSSSVESGFVVSSSSDKTQTGTKPGTDKLDFYLEQFGIADSSFGGLLAGSAENQKSNTTPGTGDTTEQGSAMAPEFDGPWPHVFVKGNIGALEYFFPKAVVIYADLIDSIQSGTASEECKLYMLNVKGNSKSVGHVLAHVSEDTVTVLDIT